MMMKRKDMTNFSHVRLKLFGYLLLIAAVINLSKPSKAFTIHSSSQSSKKVSQQQSYRDRQISYHQCQKPPTLSLSSLVLHVSKLSDADTSTTLDDDDDDDDDEDDEKLLRETKKEQLTSLCEQFDLPVEGTKEELLIRLRSHAQQKVEEERQRMEDRKKRIEEGGGDNDREKYEIVNGGDEGENDDDDDDNEAYFYFETQETVPDFEDNSSKEGDDDEETNKKNQYRTDNRPITPGTLTAPPPPPGVEPNEDGERVVTIYSTSDQNDLTGVAAAQPGQAQMQDPMTASVGEPENAPWDFQKNQNSPDGNQKSEASEAELEIAKAAVGELVQSLLAMTGAPGFAYSDDGGDFDDQDNDNDENMLSSVGIFRQKTSLPSSSFAAPGGFVGFDPTKV
ncbi:MAG: hypothetical protein ACI90V_013420, partial [Bacillariaceae sp.]